MVAAKNISGVAAANSCIALTIEVSTTVMMAMMAMMTMMTMMTMKDDVGGRYATKQPE